MIKTNSKVVWNFGIQSYQQSTLKTKKRESISYFYCLLYDQWVSDVQFFEVFRGYRKRPVVWNRVKTPRIKLFFSFFFFENCMFFICSVTKNHYYVKGVFLWILRKFLEHLEDLRAKTVSVESTTLNCRWLWVAPINQLLLTLFALLQGERFGMP